MEKLKIEISEGERSDHADLTINWPDNYEFKHIEQMTDQEIMSELILLKETYDPNASRFDLMLKLLEIRYFLPKHLNPDYLCFQKLHSIQKKFVPIDPQIMGMTVQQLITKLKEAEVNGNEDEPHEVLASRLQLIYNEFPELNKLSSQVIDHEPVGVAIEQPSENISMDIAELQSLDPSTMTKEQLIYEIVNGYADIANIYMSHDKLVEKLSTLRSEFGLLDGGYLTLKNNNTKDLYYKKYLKYKKKYLVLKNKLKNL
jgi:hypothetical protein